MKNKLLSILAVFFVFVLSHAALANQPPQASFTYFPSLPDTLDIVQFIDASTDLDGAIISWYWDFGDGDTSTMQNPTHQYAAPGSYVVSLTVTDNEGASDTYSEGITVVRPPVPKRSRFKLHVGMLPQGTQTESAKFDFDLEAYLDFAATWDKTTFSLMGITGVAGPELAIFGVETELGLASLQDQLIFATPFDSENRRLGGLRFVKKRFTTEFDFAGFELENLLVAEDIHFTYPYPSAVQTPEYKFGDILTLKATTTGGIRLTSVLGLCADPQKTNLLKKKSFRGEACEGDFGFTVEKVFIEDLTIGNLRLDSETEFRLEEPTAETLEAFLTLPGIGDLTAVLSTEDILSLELERIILKLRSGAFTLTTVFNSTFTITRNSVIANLRLFDQMTLITTATLVPSTGLTSLTLYSLISVSKAARFRVLTIFSGGEWSSSSFTLSTVIGELEFDTQAKFLSTGLDEVTFDLELMF